MDLVKPKEEVILNVFAPLSEVFSDTSLIDTDNPNVELKGYVIRDKSEIPFSKHLGIK